jgi:hypothetical protein
MQWLIVVRVVAGHSGGGRAGITPASRSLTQRKLGKNCVHYMRVFARVVGCLRAAARVDGMQTLRESQNAAAKPA